MNNDLTYAQYNEMDQGMPYEGVFDRQFGFGAPFGFGYGRPFGYGLGGPFVGGFLGGLVGSALLRPYAYPYYGYGRYPYYPIYYY